MRVSMTTVAMTVTLLLVSTATTGIPLKTSKAEIVTDTGLKTTDNQTPPKHGSIHQNERMTSKDVVSPIAQYVNDGQDLSASDSDNRQQRTSPLVSESYADDEKNQIPTRIRRTSQCRRQTDDELMDILQSLGQVNTRYADKSHQGFTSLMSFGTNEELDRLTKLQIEAALRGNPSAKESLPHPHINAIRTNLVTPEEANVPRIRRSVVGTTVSNFCILSGQEATQGFMRMCDSCPATTELSDDLFPRYVNEVVCSSNTDCLSGGGRCSERTLNITVLRRTEHCSVAANTSTTGQVLYVEDWEPAEQRIRVACECDVGIQSVFATYV
ncbi:uncharacterized protein LOC110982466 [Acanthaster planci]|uniref:Uncharacterized protein LOC110982466 n=1 Tax=Acanthaster planci TaxID=133434 RepID=A0A8B7YTE1_ACAPL|nr:uncharacterized protein LOC110982466 [Acanthaster planci]